MFLHYSLLLFLNISAKHGLEGFKELFREGENLDKVLHTMGVTAILSGAIGTMIGMIIMLGNLSDQGRHYCLPMAIVF